MKQCIAVSCFLTMFSAGAPAEPDFTVRQVLDLFEGSLQTISSFDVRVECSRKFLLKTEAVQDLSRGNKRLLIKDIRELRPQEQPQILKKTYRQVFQQGRGRVETLEVDGKKTVEVTVYDGESQKCYQPLQKQGSIRNKATRLIEEGWDYHEAYDTVYGDFSILTCFRERKYNTKVRQEPNSPSLVILESPPDPNAQNKISYQ